MTVSNPRILVTARQSAVGLARLRELGTVDLAGEAVGRRPLSADELCIESPKHDVLIVETDPVTGDVLRRNPRLMAVACCRGNPVNVDAATAAALGIPILYTPGRNAEAVADFTIGLIISQLRHIADSYHLLLSEQLTGGAHQAEMRTGGENTWRTEDGVPRSRQFAGPELNTLVLGIIGFGQIGRAVALRGLAFGMKVVAFDPYRRSRLSRVAMVSLPVLLRSADVISVHCKLTTETDGMIGAGELALVKPEAVLVNTARAKVVDEVALVDALRRGALRGAALDVFREEPLPPESPFFALPNVTLTPHLGGASSSVVERQSGMVVEDLERLLSGRRPRHVFRLA
jgi:phosphoglycerate dehydrogenase-like enzyme